MSLPVEFTMEALEDIEDIVRVARKLSRLAPWGKVACGQSDPLLRELVIGRLRLLYRLEETQIVVLGADEVRPFAH